MNENKPVKHGALWTVLFAVVSLFWIFPIVLVLINSFKQKAYISKNAFSLPAGKAFVGLENYVRGIETTQFFASFGWTLLITVGSVALILVCTSMCAWWIVRVNNWAAKLLYTLFLFNMIVPFQMVMFTLSKIADMLKLKDFYIAKRITEEFLLSDDLLERTLAEFRRTQPFIAILNRAVQFAYEEMM